VPGAGGVGRVSEMRVDFTPQTVHRSQRYSWMFSGWIRAAAIAPGRGGTEFVTIGVPDDIYAVRIGLASLSRSPWTVSKVIACAWPPGMSTSIRLGGCAAVLRRLVAGDVHQRRNGAGNAGRRTHTMRSPLLGRNRVGCAPVARCDNGWRVQWDLS
jgi:hypothetical protein